MTERVTSALNNTLEALEQVLVAAYRKFLEDQSIYEDFKSLGATELSDAMKGRGVMDPAIKPLALNMKVLGRAFTVQLPPGDGALTLEAISAAQPGDILVIHAGGTLDRAVWGDVKAMMAMKKRLGGVVVDGGIRDQKKTIELGFPVFTRTKVAQASGKGKGGCMNVPVVCGGVLVQPGDLILGDADGIVVIPPVEISFALEAALLKRHEDEAKILKLLSDGVE